MNTDKVKVTEKIQNEGGRAGSDKNEAFHDPDTENMNRKSEKVSMSCEEIQFSSFIKQNTENTQHKFQSSLTSIP